MTGKEVHRIYSYIVEDDSGPSYKRFGVTNVAREAEGGPTQRAIVARIRETDVEAGLLAALILHPDLELMRFRHRATKKRIVVFGRKDGNNAHNGTGWVVMVERQQVITNVGRGAMVCFGCKQTKRYV